MLCAEVTFKNNVVFGFPSRSPSVLILSNIIDVSWLGFSKKECDGVTKPSVHCDAVPIKGKVLVKQKHSVITAHS